MHQKSSYYLSKRWLWLLAAVLSAIVMITASAGVNLWYGQSAQALTITPGNVGIAQGALVDRPVEYQKQVLDATQNSGAKWIRLDLWWFQVEETKGNFVWDKFDNLYADAKARGLNVLVVVTGAPHWASGCSTTVHCPPDVDHLDDWRNFLTMAVNKYKTDTYGITAYEIWNEPNLERFFSTPGGGGPNTQVYVNQVLIPAYQAITAALPSATVVTGGTSPATWDHPVNISPWEFIRDIYAFGGKDYFHHIAHHPYSFPDEPTAGDASWNSFLQMYENPPANSEDPNPKSIRQYMLDNADGAKEIWATEIGYPTGGCGKPCVDEPTQERMLARVFNEWSKKEYFGKLFWYNGLDDSPEGEYKYGLVRGDNTAKPSYATFSKIASEDYFNSVRNTAGLRHYWKLDELRDTTAYDSVATGGTHGSYIGTVARGTDNVVVGTPAATFPEEINNRVEVVNSDSATRLAGSSWTIEFNARRVGGTLTWPGLMGRGNPRSADGWLIYNHHGNSDRLSFGRDSKECMTTSTAFGDGKARHYAVTYSNGRVQWYVNGEEAGSCRMKFATPSTDAHTLFLGASPDQPGNNAVGHVAIYDTALSKEQVAAHAAKAVRLP